jgi:hypothetical protein
MREMNAREMRERRMLWPQTLCNLDLIQELRGCDADANPISHRMLMDEYHDRIEKGIIAL